MLQAENMSLVSEINGEDQPWKLKVKIIRLWKQTFSNNPHVVSSIDMVLIDEQGSRIQATVKHKLIPKFAALLEEGGIRVISNFGVGENKGRFLLTRHPCKINFYPNTSVRLSNDWAGPDQSIHLLSFDDILTKNFESVYSFDVIGEVVHCQDTKVMTTKGKERRVKNLQLQNHYPGKHSHSPMVGQQDIQTNKVQTTCRMGKCRQLSAKILD
uniref:uncharacterized protein LOC122590725 n=1 Tax=Erigeron canadensis TaxID=72917 RepID=UPI001CB92778|nr:uncharacterized protein LOC122590725 [Erigeron canadensis]